MKGNKMKYITLILIAIAFCAMAQDKGGSAPVEYSVRSAIGRPIVGTAGDGEHGMKAVVAFEDRVAISAKRLPDPTDRPLAFGIGEVTPNPFNPICEIEFEIGEKSPVTLEIFDISGRLVAKIIDEPEMSPGVYRIAWDGGAQNPSGTYLARLSAGNKSDVRRLLYIK